MASNSNDGNGIDSFAVLRGQDFLYYIHKHSITLGRNSKTAKVDVDLASHGGNATISRHHARIFFDFQPQCFFLQVLGKNGCFVRGTYYRPNNPPVHLDDMNLIQIGDKRFYFQLPTGRPFGDSVIPPHHPRLPPHPSSSDHLPPPRLTMPPPLPFPSSKGDAGPSRVYVILDNDEE